MRSAFSLRLLPGLLPGLLVPASLASLALLSAGDAAAQVPPADAPPAVTADVATPVTEIKTEELATPEAAKVRPDGWTPGIAFGATMNLNDSRDVVGTQNGTSFTAGFLLDSELLFNKGMHEWRNTLKAGAGATHAPAIDEFVKTNDGLALESIYLLHLIEVLGPFARFAMNTNMFPSLDIRPAPVNYAIAELDGTTTTLAGRRLDLTDPFSPIILKQSLGIFTQPLNKDWMKLEARAGLGAQEGVVGEDNLAIVDDAETPNVVETSVLDDFFLVGAEGVVNIWGFFDEAKRVSYTAGIGVLIPFVTNELPAGDDRGLAELTAVEGNAGLNAKLFDWASFTYRFSAVRQPLLVDQWQVSNMALLTFAAAFGSKAPAPEPECDCPPPEPAAPAAPGAGDPVAPPADPAAPPADAAAPPPAPPAEPPPPAPAPPPAAPPAGAP